LCWKGLYHVCFGVDIDGEPWGFHRRSGATSQKRGL